MIKKILVIWIIILFLIMNINLSVAMYDEKKYSNPITEGKTLYVGGFGTDNYSSIQEALNDALDGDTVFVYDEGSPYNEQITITKRINLIGEDRNTTIIDGQFQLEILVKIISDDVFISGFTIRNIDYWGNNFDNSIIEIQHSDNVTIKNNILIMGDLDYNSWYGVIEVFASSYCKIKNNIITEPVDTYVGKTYGIILREGSSSNIISGNDISRHTFGIYIYRDNGVSNKYNNIIGNFVHHNLRGIVIHSEKNSHNKIIENIVENNEINGIVCEYSDNTTISGNIITNNGKGYEFDCGIDLYGEYNDITNNVISNNNPTGIYIWDSLNQIINNQISNNYQFGIQTYFAHGCKISRNNFIDNGEYNAYFEDNIAYCYTNKWRNNYWSDKTNGIIIHRIRGFIHFLGFIPISWINIDWFPARKPHDIGTIYGCDIK